MTKLTTLMKAVLVLGAGLFVTNSAWAAADAAARQKAEAEVREAVNAFAKAYTGTNVDPYFAFYADDLAFASGPGGWGTKQAYYESWKTGVAAGGGVSSATPTDVRVQVGPSADAAIASYHLKAVRRKPREGQDPNVTYNFTVAWFKINNQWKVQSIAFTTANADAKGPVQAVGKAN